MNISAGSGTAGGGSRIIIRGQSSLGSAGSPLFVIDGMPVSNQSYDPVGLNGSVDVGNRMGDISGDDIESINVLKGAAATALYGARAKDGAIIITTKKGSRMQKTSVSINSSTASTMYCACPISRTPTHRVREPRAPMTWTT